MQALAHRVDDPAVRLVIDEQVDVGQGQPGRADDLHGHLAHQLDRVPVHGRAVHPDQQFVAGQPDQLAAVPVRGQHGRAELGSAGRGGEQDRARPVAEQHGRGRVIPVEVAGQQVGADREHGPGPARLDHPGPHHQAGQEARAGRADVDGRRAVRADVRGHQRRGVRAHVLGTGGADQDDVHVRRVHPGLREGVPGGLRRELVEPLAGPGHVPFAGSGAPGDPLLRHAEPVGDGRVRHDLLGHRHPDGGECGADPARQPPPRLR